MIDQKNKILTRPATPDDVATLIDLRKYLLSTGEGHYASKTPEEEIAWQTSYQEWLLRHMEDNEKIRVVVAHQDGDSDLSACAIGIIDERAPMKGCLNGKVGWIQTVVVHPDMRHRGFAQAVMNHLFTWFKENNVGKIVLQTTPVAKNLYTKLGFIESGEDLLLKEF